MAFFYLTDAHLRDIPHGKAADLVGFPKDLATKHTEITERLFNKPAF